MAAVRAASGASRSRSSISSTPRATTSSSQMPLASPLSTTTPPFSTSCSSSKQVLADGYRDEDTVCVSLAGLTLSDDNRAQAATSPTTSGSPLGFAAAVRAEATVTPRRLNWKSGIVPSPRAAVSPTVTPFVFFENEMSPTVTRTVSFEKTSPTVTFKNTSPSLGADRCESATVVLLSPPKTTVFRTPPQTQSKNLLARATVPRKQPPHTAFTPSPLRQSAIPGVDKTTVPRETSSFATPSLGGYRGAPATVIAHQKTTIIPQKSVTVLQKKGTVPQKSTASSPAEAGPRRVRTLSATVPTLAATVPTRPLSLRFGPGARMLQMALDQSVKSITKATTVPRHDTVSLPDTVPPRPRNQVST
ncbi:hypothetical protein PFISCL1PPCAC_17063 [Pristionchus fissidentatus]|uniref:Uncharacterized protein n=1 Tax=Pristionchus fissidentatus TaxID=1538716 RepID=A0AAV5W1S0_9BILA|nr:hypothetical protein PFISCL1PPCAC_17063 [Pristionchus fissidentatus]